jgi:hypothetical protein
VNEFDAEAEETVFGVLAEDSPGLATLVQGKHVMGLDSIRSAQDLHYVLQRDPSLCDLFQK